ncbi:MAG: cyclohexadienyl dehydratase [Spirochaetales bacterium]|nr:cyclohexadienyl dehydratase [Spirochaetales bacterium]
MKSTRLIRGIAVFSAAIILIAACRQDNRKDESSAEAQAGAVKSALNTILERGTIRVGTTGDFNPFSFKDPETGEYKGHDIELVKKLAADIGVEVEWVATDWKNLVSGVAAGKYDITTGASYNMGRAKTAGYTLPVIQVGTVPMTLKKNVSKFQSWEDIDKADVTVAVTLGTVFEDQAKALFNLAQIKAVESPARDYQEVLAGRVPVSITSTFEASKLADTYEELAIVPVNAPRFQNAIGILVSQDDQILINYINVWITMQRYGGFLAELSTKWLPSLEF